MKSLRWSNNKKSSHLGTFDLAEGCSRKSIIERRRFFEIARGSVIEIYTAIGMHIN